MINIIDYTAPEDEDYLEVPEIELELVEVPDKNAIVLIP